MKKSLILLGLSILNIFYLLMIYNLVGIDSGVDVSSVQFDSISSRLILLMKWIDGNFDNIVVHILGLLAGVAVGTIILRIYNSKHPVADDDDRI